MTGMVEQGKILKGTSDAQTFPGIRLHVGDLLSSEQDATFGRPVAPRDTIDDRCLPGPIRTDDRESAALFHSKADIRQSTDATKAQRNLLHF